MSRLVAEPETANGRRPRFDMAHRSYAASSVIASAGFLEAAVSELFQDAMDGQAVRSGERPRPAGTWIRSTSGWLLECAGHDRLDRGAAPAQDAAVLIRLRNALLHFKPENVAADDEHELESACGISSPGTG